MQLELQELGKAVTFGPSTAAHDLARHRHEYLSDGVTVIDNVIPQPLVERWREWALDPAGAFVQAVEGVADGWEYQEDGHVHRYRMIDGESIKRHLPDLYCTYLGFLPIVRDVASPLAVTSPYKLSDVNLVVYGGAGSTIGWHYDTNPITVLIYLTTNSEGGTECRLLPRRPDSPERTRVVLPRAGSALLMQGCRVLHRGLPVAGETKVASPWNFYTVDDVTRSEGFDDKLYRGKN